MKVVFNKGQGKVQLIQAASVSEANIIGEDAHRKCSQDTETVNYNFGSILIILYSNNNLQLLSFTKSAVGPLLIR